MSVVEAIDHEAAARVDRARRLFEFLARAQALKIPRIRDVQSYEHVLWLGDLPAHPEAAFDLGPEAGPERPVLVLARVSRTPAPPAPEAVRPWLRSAVTADTPPTLLTTIALTPPDRPNPEHEPAAAHLSDHPEVTAAFDRWLPLWSAWAERDRAEQRLQAIYRDLFASYERSTGKPDEYELVVGVACVAWSPPASQPLRRHLFTTPARLELDDATGRLIASVDAGAGFLLETDMLDPGQIPAAIDLDGDTRLVAGSAAHPLDVEAVGHLARRFVLNLSPDSTYDDTLDRPTISSNPRGTFGPALILRRRSARGLVQLLRDIRDQLEAAEEVPPGLRPLVDPDYRRVVDRDPVPGGLISVDEEIFQVLPVNDRQQQVISNVDSYAQTLVQGPPGTGKTHTAAALLTHLLAQGKRVLITAQTDRALMEVRGKLPEAIRPLAVSVLGATRADTADLKTAVETIATQAGEFDHRRAATEIDQRLASIDDLRRQRADAYRALRALRERETVEFRHLSYGGTLAVIARRVQDQEPAYGWLRQFVVPDADSAVPLTADEAAEWLTLVRDPDLERNATEAAKDLPSLTSLPTVDQWADLVGAIERAEAKVSRLKEHRAHPAFQALQAVAAPARRPIQERMRRLGRWAADLERRRETWTADALADIRAGRRTVWAKRASAVTDLCAEATPLVQELGHRPNVTVAQGDLSVLRHQASELLPVVEGGHVIRRGADGAAKIGVFSPRAVKGAGQFLAAVTVDGLPPTTAEQLRRFLLHLQVEDVLAALDRAWPSSVHIPQEDTARERLDWHLAELEQLTTLLQLGEAIGEANRAVDAAGLPRPDWTSLHDIDTYASAVDAADAENALLEARQPLDLLVAQMQRLAESRSVAHVVHEICAALPDRDVGRYRKHRERLEELHRAKMQLERRTGLGARLRRVAPRLIAAVEADPGAGEWSERLRRLPHAWEWAATAVWVVSHEQADVNALRQRLDGIEAQIRGQIERLAATRAWRHAVSPDRLTGTARADLTQYAQLVRRLGRGTGKYAAAQRAEIREALDRCSTAVPVWIMPLYRIAEQLTVHESMFDVVVVDEASQAGMEAAFLQYLATKIVVIGDDKQVSPTAVGVDRQQLRDLADQYLRDDRYKASWQDPERSLFDEAKMRYGSMITLVEHRRCVPEIIGFSNRIAYEPEGIRLIPVRQYGSDRLEPVVPVHVADGYEIGSTTKVNPAEVDAVVEQIEKCLADPRYDGMTFGVISLLGTAQARRIEARLLDRVPAEEWSTRDLRCGDAADFQGSERDVILLTMVAAPSDRRLPALTRDLYVQRYNVAASRAKDQLWLFHSLQLSDVVNSDDMRFQLLDYCYGVANRRHAPADDAVITAVPEDVLVDPFDSLFEQRVFNRILDRGYTVQPQVSTDSYRIDLVVVGARARLAIECDGDRWHGPDRYTTDLARQRDLERAGWTFFRIRESEFYVDAAGVFERLWRKLVDLDIHPHNQERAMGDDEAALTAELGSVAELEQEITEFIADTPPTQEEVGATDAQPEPALLEQRNNEPAGTSTHTEPGPEDPLPSYRVFWGDVPHPVEASSADVMRGLIGIVATEGPVTRSRLFFAYVQCSEVQRAGKIIVNHLAQALGKAVRSGHLVAEGQGANVTYRLADQPPVRRRQLGPRTLAEVPPAELAALVRDAAGLHGWDDDELLFREVLARIGLRRLSSETRRVLTKALASAKVSADELTEPF